MTQQIEGLQINKLESTPYNAIDCFPAVNLAAAVDGYLLTNNAITFQGCKIFPLS